MGVPAARLRSCQDIQIQPLVQVRCASINSYNIASILTKPTSLGGFQIPTWTSALVAIFVINFLIPNTSLLGHLCSALVGYGWELGYLKFLVPPERILRWIESKLNLLGRLPHYVSVDQKTFGRYGVLPSREDPEVPGTARSFFVGSSQRLGP